MRGALVRDLRPDELSLALRLRVVSEAEGAAAAEAEAARATSSDGALRRVKFFHRSVLPEFVAWLYWPERQQAKLGW